jgi:hypothetical protein
MQQMENDASRVSRALIDVVVEQIRTLGALVTTQQGQMSSLHLELRDRLDVQHKQSIDLQKQIVDLHDELRVWQTQKDRVVLRLVVLLFAALVAVARMIILINR